MNKTVLNYRLTDFDIIRFYESLSPELQFKFEADLMVSEPGIFAETFSNYIASQRFPEHIKERAKGIIPKYNLIIQQNKGYENI